MFSAEPAVAIKFLISVMDGSFSPDGLFGPEVFDIEDIAESIEDVRGMVACTRGSVFEVEEAVDAAEEGLWQ